MEALLLLAVLVIAWLVALLAFIWLVPGLIVVAVAKAADGDIES